MASGDVRYLKAESGAILTAQQITDLKAVHNALVTEPSANKAVGMYFWRLFPDTDVSYRATEQNVALEADFIQLPQSETVFVSYLAPNVTYDRVWPAVPATSQKAAIKAVVLDVYAGIGANNFRDVKVYKSGANLLMDVNYEAVATPVAWVEALAAGAPLGQFLSIEP